MRESQEPREGRGSIFRLGLEVIVPGPVSTNLEGGSDISSTSHPKYLSVHERTNSVVETVPDITCIRTDFKLGPTPTCTWTWTRWSARIWTRRLARVLRVLRVLRKQRRLCKRKGEQNQENENSDSHLIDHLPLGHNHFTSCN